jgi:hypothetical protein
MEKFDGVKLYCFYKKLINIHSLVNEIGVLFLTINALVEKVSKQNFE